MAAPESYIISAQEWWSAVKKAWDIQKEYGVTVDPATLLHVPDPLRLVAGLNRQLFNIVRPEEFVSRPVGFQVKGDYIIVKYPNGAKAYTHIRGKTAEERIKHAMKVARSYHVVALNGHTSYGPKYVVREIMDITADREAAENVMIRYGIREATAMALGLKPEALDKYWWRAVPLIIKAHILELTPPATGKSTYAWYVSRILGGIVLNEPPTAAFVAGDARDGSFGAAYTSNVLVFDEVDKWHRRTDGLMMMDIILSGMENCTWARGAGKGLSYSKCVSTAWLGNTPQGLKPERDSVKEVMSKLLRVNAGPLVDRMSVIAVEAPRFRTEYVGDMLKPSVIRGLSQIMTEEAYRKWEELRKEAWDVRSAWHLAVIMTARRFVRGDPIPIDEAISIYQIRTGGQ
jgi:hypothetical protein